MDWQSIAVGICVAAAAAAALWRIAAGVRGRRNGTCSGCGQSDCPKMARQALKKSKNLKIN